MRTIFLWIIASRPVKFTPFKDILLYFFSIFNYFFGPDLEKDQQMGLKIHKAWSVAKCWKGVIGTNRILFCISEDFVPRAFSFFKAGTNTFYEIDKKMIVFFLKT